MKLFGKSSPEPSFTLEALYASSFGEITSVFHQIDARQPHIDVYRFDARPGRAFCTYVSAGMSRRAQPSAPTDLAHAELLFYAERHDPLYPELLRKFAHYPWETGTCFAGWDTLPLGRHGRVLLGVEGFAGIIVCPSTRHEDQSLAGGMRKLAPMVSPLMLIPLRNDEFEFVLNRGVDPFLKRVSKSQHSVIFAPSRKSVLEDTETDEAESGAPFVSAN